MYLKTLKIAKAIQTSTTTFSLLTRIYDSQLTRMSHTAKRRHDQMNHKVRRVGKQAIIHTTPVAVIVRHSTIVVHQSPAIKFIPIHLPCIQTTRTRPSRSASNRLTLSWFPSVWICILMPLRSRTREREGEQDIFT